MQSLKYTTFNIWNRLFSLIIFFIVSDFYLNFFFTKNLSNFTYQKKLKKLVNTHSFYCFDFIKIGIKTYYFIYFFILHSF